MLEHAEHFFWQVYLAHAEVVIQPGQRTPAQMNGGIYVFAAVIHDLAQLVPVVHILIVQVLNGGTGDDHTVKALIAHRIKGFIKRLHVLLRGVGGIMGLGLQKGQLHLQGAVGQKACQLGFRYNFGGHQVQNQDAQGTDLLGLRTLLVHDKHVLARKFAIGGQLFGNDQRHKQ